MQTFLPYPSLLESARCLDRARLGKQRVEAWQLLRASALGPGAPWYAHPAARMWRGYDAALALYGRLVCLMWRARGYHDTMLERFDRWLPPPGEFIGIARPPWLGDPAFHASHRSNLLRKDPTWYGRFNWPEPPDLPYVWPVPEEVTP